MELVLQEALANDNRLIFTLDGISGSGDVRVLNYDLSAFAGADLQIGGTAADDEPGDTTGGTDADLAGSIAYGDGDTIPKRFTLTFNLGDTLPGPSAIAIDIFTFGYDTEEKENINNAIYRLELAEDGDNSSDFIGTLEYIGLNQINIREQSTYEGIDALGDSIILISDDSSISVEYVDLDSTGGTSTLTAEADTPTHSGSISLDSDGYKVFDTVTVTVEDADLNVDSSRADVYTVYEDQVDSANAIPDLHLLNVSIDSNLWDDRCGDAYGLEATQFSLRETGSNSGVFAGTFSVPAEYCADSDSGAITVTGADISAEYVDFKDDSGSTITVSASAGIRSSTGSVSLDRTVYPVPFSASSFETHEGLLPEGALTVYVSIEDSDFDGSSNGIDSIPAERLTIEVIRGSGNFTIDKTDTEISETAADSGIFEYEATLTYAMGPESDNKCATDDSNCILQGDILHVHIQRSVRRIRK